MDGTDRLMDVQSGNRMYPDKHSVQRYNYFMCTEMGRQSVHKIKSLLYLALHNFFSTKTGTPKMILWTLPCRYAGEIKGLSLWEDYEISAGGDKEAPQGYYTNEGILMMYNTCTSTSLVTYG